jgi:hypothetical protein
MSSKDTHDERDLGYDGLNRRNILLAGSTLAAASALSSSLSSAQQAGASGAYSNSAITMQPPSKEVPASQQERVLAAKIARAMLSGPREITKDAQLRKWAWTAISSSSAKEPMIGSAFPEMRMRSAMFLCAPIRWACNG